MSFKIVDTTLRDGEQKAGIAFSIVDKVEIAKKLNDMGIFQLEAGIAAMGGDEKKSIEKIAGLGLKSKIASWSRMNNKDIQDSIDCGVDIVHISVPVSDLQIKSKLAKDREWVKNIMKKSIEFAKKKEIEITIGFEDASRADLNFIIELCGIVQKYGIERVRYADTVGNLFPRRIYNEIKRIRKEVPIEIEVHFHNDLGMAVANSVAAFVAGAQYIDCTINGIGERAGNCNFIEFIKAMKALEKGSGENPNIENLIQLENEVRNIIKNGIE